MGIKKWLRQYLGIDADVEGYHKVMAQHRAESRQYLTELINQMTNQFAAHDHANRERIHRGNIVSSVLPILIQHELQQGAWKHLCDASINQAIKDAFTIAEAAIVEHKKCE